MRTDPRTCRSSHGWCPLLNVLILTCLAAVACQEPLTEPEAGLELQAAAAMTSSNAPFTTWHQGFNHGTEGWYGGETEGGLGWCGEIKQVDRRESSLEPSAGRGYATVALGGCNDFWIAEGFSENLVNAPWAPGPDFSLFSDVWPASGFVYELDIYLEPTWTANEPEPPLFNDQAPPGSVFTYVGAVREIATDAFFYFAVPVLPDNGALSILGHTVDEPGWYTFRHVFAAEGGHLSVTFELASRRGGTIFAQAIDTEFFGQTEVWDLPVADLSSGYVWFAAIADGLEVPIDEHRVMRGR